MRACLACDGTGCEDGWIHSLLEESGNAQCRYPCPVCLGSGRISDVIPNADSLADAETLRRFWLQHGTTDNHCCFPAWSPFPPKTTTVLVQTPYGWE